MDDRRTEQDTAGSLQARVKHHRDQNRRNQVSKKAMGMLGTAMEKADVSQDEGEPVTAFDGIMERIFNSANRVVSSAIRIEEIGARIMGTLPEKDECSNEAIHSEPDGTLDHTYRALNRLDSSLARLETAVVRVEFL